MILEEYNREHNANDINIIFFDVLISTGNVAQFDKYSFLTDFNIVFLIINKREDYS